MSRHQLFGTLGIALVASSLAVLFIGTGGALTTFFLGALLAVLSVLGNRMEHDTSTPFIPSAKEIHEAAEANARRQKVLIDLEDAQRERRIRCYVDAIANDYDSKIADALKRGAVLNRTGYLERPKALAGESQSEVDEAYRRFCKMRGLLNPRAA